MLAGLRMVLVAIAVSACAPAVATTRSAASPSDPTSPRAGDGGRFAEPTVQLRFESADAVQIAGVEGASGERELIPDRTTGVAVLADAAGARGVLVPLGAVLEGAAPRRISIEPTAWCPAPWIVQVDAPHLVAHTTITAPPASLRAGCGPLQHADFVTGFGRERVLVYGDAGFDPRMVASELGIVRSDLERLFDVRIAELWINEVVVAPHGTVGEPQAHANARGLRMQLDGAETWAAAARLEYGATISRVWTSKLVDHLAPPDHAEILTPDRAALVHGLGRGIARESLFELGLLSPDDYAGDLDRAETIVAERSGAWRLAGATDARDVAARAAAVSIEAALLAWTLREAESPTTLTQALRESGPARHDRGVEDAAGLWSALVAGVRPRRLGACILPKATKTMVVELGVHTPWDPQGDVRVAAVDEHGVGARAGVRVGDVVVRVMASKHGATLVLQRDGSTTDFDVDVRPEVVTRRGWTRRRDVDDERCYPAG